MFLRYSLEIDLHISISYYSIVFAMDAITVDAPIGLKFTNEPNKRTKLRTLAAAKQKLTRSLTLQLTYQKTRV